jgi:inorganic triphosphatase YgiF
MAEEIELKLALAPGARARLRRDPLLAGARSDGSRRLVTTYYDTPDLALGRLGVGLRLRRIGRRHLQCVKTPTEEGGALHRYREIEIELPNDRLDLLRIEDDELRKLFAKRKIADRLAPIFATEIRRSLWTFRHAGALIELALDQGEIRAGERSLGVSEIELELKGGRASGLHQAALALAGRLPVRVEWRTKAMRGYALCTDAAPKAERARRVALGKGVTPRAAFGSVARACLRQLGGSEAAALQATDTEGVHQMRVALRRLRALVGAFRNHMTDDCHAELSRELRWLQRSLSPARDWDVFLVYTMPPIRRRLPDEPSLVLLAELAEAKREAAYAAMQETLRSARYTTLLLRLGFWLDSGRWASAEGAPAPLDLPCRRFADRLLAKRHRRLRKLGRRENLTENELHRLRLFGKKMRYVADFFRSLYGAKAADEYIAALSELQDRLGSINDAVVTDMLLAEIDGDADDAAAIDHAVALLKGWQARGIEFEMEAFDAVWRQFERRKPFWRKG